MIEIAAGVIGFASGIALTVWLSRRNRARNNNWSKGYRILGKNRDHPNLPSNRTNQSYGSSSYNYNRNSSYNEPENKEPPTMPDWF